MVNKKSRYKVYESINHNVNNPIHEEHSDITATKQQSMKSIVENFQLV